MKGNEIVWINIDFTSILANKCGKKYPKLIIFSEAIYFFSMFLFEPACSRSMITNFTIKMFFSLRPFAPKMASTLKFQLIRVTILEEISNKQTDKLTDILFPQNIDVN